MGLFNVVLSSEGIGCGQCDRVVVEGWADDCSGCGVDEDVRVDILIRDDVIESAVRSTGEVDHRSQGHGDWVVLAEDAGEGPIRG